MPPDDIVRLVPETTLPVQRKRRWSPPTVIRSEIEETEKFLHVSEVTVPIVQTGVS
ncbi:MAG TPA: hypothetical protein VMC05_00100 [Xanthobacteraceae bacterium]|nr:hypothetical protein [Xanthobacteraceae bacterium]